MLKLQASTILGPGTEELMDHIQGERVSRLRRQSAVLDMSYKCQGQGQIRSPKVIWNYLFNMGMSDTCFMCNFIHKMQWWGKKDSGQNLKLAYQSKMGVHLFQFYYEFIAGILLPVSSIQSREQCIRKLVYAVYVFFTIVVSNIMELPQNLACA